MPIDAPAGGFSLAAFGAAWLLSFALHSTVLLGGIWLLSRRAGLPVSLRETLWKVALVGGVLSATWQAAGIGGAPLGGRLTLSALAGPGIPAAAPGMLAAGGAPAASAPWWEGIGLAPVLLGLWAFGVGAGLIRLVLARRRLARLLGPRREVREGPAVDALARVCRSSGFRGRVRLTVSPGIGGPMALGGSEICLPERALVGLTPEQQESALAHELAHLVRRDPGWNWLAAILGHVFFFQPLIRVARRHLRESAEYLSDDWAVRHTGRGVVLARCLVEVAGWQGARPVAVHGAAMADHPSSLARRIERLVGGPRREPPLALRLAGAFVLLVGVTALAPGVTPRREYPSLYTSPQWAVFSAETPMIPPSVVAIPPRDVPETVTPPTPAVRSRRAHRGAPPAAGTRSSRRSPVAMVVFLPGPEGATPVIHPVVRRILRDEVMAPAARAATAEEIEVRLAYVEARRTAFERVILSQNALREAMAADQSRWAELHRAFLDACREGRDSEALQLLLQASEADLRGRLEALQAARVLSDKT